ncbi:DUF5937 family protein [Lacticaseibacillus rhamnosus]|uniref:ArsR/SmtB family transcription factor n=1 Tax=Lacticaseibacillus rhamnosus TaxID=47715 RepID=UPI00237F6AE1|nr:DUF5937 family protein [Lacticaseibacillus rhamnosus]MDE3292924.1 DUF5937 family protein [Lacticaseibacillus rhamnosus]
MAISIIFGKYARQTNETMTQRVQFVYSPLNELFRSLHVLLNPRHHGMNIDWALAAKSRMSPDTLKNLRYFELIYELGVPSVFFNNFQNLSASLDEEIINLKQYLSRENPEIVFQSLDSVVRDRENRFIPTLAKSLEWQDYQPAGSEQLLSDLRTRPRNVYERLFEFIATYRQEVFDDTWQKYALSNFLITEIQRQSQYLHTHGFIQLVNHLQVERLHWKGEALEVIKPFDEKISLKETDVILLVPSYFVWPHLFVEHFSQGVTITYDALNKIKTRISADELSGIFTALSDPVRLRMLGYLKKEAQTTQSLGQMLVMSASTVSHHLKLLREANLVKTRKQGKFVLYSTTDVIEKLMPNFYAYFQMET